MCFQGSSPRGGEGEGKAGLKVRGSVTFLESVNVLRAL